LHIYTLNIAEIKAKTLLVELKNIYLKIIDSYKEKRLKKQKEMLKLKMMSVYIRRIK